MKVGDLLKKKSTGQLCLLVEISEVNFGDIWIRVIIEGMRSDWISAQGYEVVNESR